MQTKYTQHKVNSTIICLIRKYVMHAGQIVWPISTRKAAKAQNPARSTVPHILERQARPFLLNGVKITNTHYRLQFPY